MNAKITDKQNKAISKYLTKTVWGYIYDKILTKEQRKAMKEDRGFRHTVVFGMEDHFKSVAAEFGLAGFEDADEDTE